MSLEDIAFNLLRDLGIKREQVEIIGTIFSLKETLAEHIDVTPELISCKGESFARITVDVYLNSGFANKHVFKEKMSALGLYYDFEENRGAYTLNLGNTRVNFFEYKA